jgi:hypothetical protein
LCQDPGAGFALNVLDCNDGNASIYPTHVELCDGLDNDCDGNNDDGLTFINYYVDQDNDGYGLTSSVQNLCSNPGAGFVTTGGDCNDVNNQFNPSITEVCDGLDNDCDGTNDNGLVFLNYYVDFDGDGQGAGAAVNACQSPGIGYVSNGTDCNDANNTVYLFAVELCDGLDNNCDGSIDNGLTFVNYFADADGDGYGIADETIQECGLMVGYAEVPGDCDDSNANVNPSETEICNTIDDDCDEEIDEFVTSTFYADTDSDGFGNPGVSTLACSAPAGYVSNNDDCDDAECSWWKMMMMRISSKRNT